MEIPVCIIGVGARTPLGLRATASAGAARAGINASREHPYLTDRTGEPMCAAIDLELDTHVLGPTRMLAIAESALREACEPLAGLSAFQARMVPQLTVYVGLPEVRPGFGLGDVAAVEDGLLTIRELPAHLSNIQGIPEGHAAGLWALATAFVRIRKGEIEACLVGGMDSYLHPDTMEWLDSGLQLLGSASRSGFIPGEGAAFILMMSEGTCNRLGLKSVGRILSVGVQRETKLIKTSDVCLGEGLTRAISDAILGLHSSGISVDAVTCDLNSERYRSEEWGFVSLRLGQYLPDPAAFLSPAECWGDMGAASGPLFAMLACRAAAKRYARGPRTLLWASSEAGLRAAVVLECDIARMLDEKRFAYA